MEERLSIAPWPVPPNENNDILRRGCEKLGIPAAAIRRNVKGCWNLGYCGMGCPTNAKQSMLVTTIPGRARAGAPSSCTARASSGSSPRATGSWPPRRAAWPARAPPPGRTASASRRAISSSPRAPSAAPRCCCEAACPIRTRSSGRRTFLHPTVVSAAVMPQPVDGYEGAPQTIYSDHFLDSVPVDGPVGYKLEAPPLHPILAGDHAAGLRRRPRATG